MTRQIFVNLPVANLDRARAFYAALGFEQNDQFSDATSACMVWSDSINVMLLTHKKWRGFTRRPIPPADSSEVLLAISVGTAQAVDDFATAAAAQGGIADINPAQDHGWMRSRAVADPDGHVWEAVWMDMAAMAGATADST